MKAHKAAPSLGDEKQTVSPLYWQPASHPVSPVSRMSPPLSGPATHHWLDATILSHSGNELAPASFSYPFADKFTPSGRNQQRLPGRSTFGPVEDTVLRRPGSEAGSPDDRIPDYEM